MDNVTSINKNLTEDESLDMTCRLISRQHEERQKSLISDEKFREAMKNMYISIGIERWTK